MIITIDGPTASGKSTVGRKLAQKLGYYYVYSGVMYRALAYILYSHFNYNKESIASPKADDIWACFDAQRFQYVYDNEKQERVVYEGKDITGNLKTMGIDALSSLVSQNKLVRDIVTQLQRDMAKNHDVIVDGRDAGSIVFPDADYKFFLTASVEVRAQRWVGQQKNQGKEFSVAQAEKIINERDMRDTNREIAPLIIPEGAIVIDNSGLNLNQTLKKMMSYLHHNV